MSNTLSSSVEAIWKGGAKQYSNVFQVQLSIEVSVNLQNSQSAVLCQMASHHDFCHNPQIDLAYFMTSWG